jgi:integrase
LHQDRKIAEAMYQEKMRITSLGFNPDAYERTRKQPVLELLAAFEESQMERGLTVGHVKDQVHKLKAALAYVRALIEVNCESVKAWILREGGSAQTKKHFVSTLRCFGNWLVKTKRMPINPFADLDGRGLNPRANPVRVRDALTPDEALRLLASVAASSSILLQMDGEQRALLYHLAIVTGFRRNSLASLTPESFSLDAQGPTVTLDAANVKNRKRKVNALSDDLAAKLRTWLVGKPLGQSLFPIKNKETANMLAIDLALAGIPRNRGGRVIDFHSLRVTCATHLFKKGAPLPLVQETLGHSKPELTSNVYSRFWPSDTGEFLNKKD